MAKSLAGCIKKVGMDKDIADEVKERTLEIRKEEGETNQSAALMAMEEMMDETVAEIGRVNEEVYAKFPELREVQEGQEGQEGQEVLEDFNTPQATVAKEPVEGIEIDGKEELERVLEEEEGTLLGLFSSFLLNRWNNGDLRVVIDMETPTSYYDPESNTVVLARRASNKTIVHELFHAMTARQIDSLEKGDPILKEIDDLRVELEAYALENNLLTVEELMMSKEEQAKLPEDKRALLYALKSNDEMISMSFTNDYVREVMTEIPSKEGGTLWSKFLDILRDVWKMIGTESSALTDLMSTADDLMKVTPSEDAAGIVEDFTVTSSLETVQATSKSVLDTFSDINKRYLKSVSDRLTEISPNLSYMASLMDSNIARRSTKAIYDGNEWQKDTYDKLEGQELEDYEYYLQKGSEKSIAKAKEIANKNGIDDKEVWDTLAVLRQEMVDTGQISAKRAKDWFFPRRVKDYEGLYDYYDEKGILPEIKKILKSRGIEATDQNIETIMSDTLGKGGYPALLGKPGSAKARTMQHFERDTAQFYYPPYDAFRMASEEMVNSIEQHKMVGASPRLALELDVEKLEAEREELKGKGEDTTAIDEKIKGKVKDLVDPTKINEEGMGSFIVKNVKDRKKQREVRDIIKARFQERGMSENWRMIKHGTLAMTLLNPTTAIKQVADVGIAMIEKGFRNAVGAVKIALGDDAGKFNLHEMGIQQYVQETGERQDRSSQWLDFGFHWSGFKIMDAFGKQVSYQASLKEIQGMSKEEFLDKFSSLESIKDKDALYDSILANDLKSKDVQDFMTWRVAELQPLFLSQMSEKLLTAGNARIFGTLLQYALRRLSMIGTHINKLRKEEGGFAATRYALAVIATLSAAEFSAECIANLMQGKPCNDIDEQIEKSILGIMLLDRYTLDEMAEGNVVAGVLSLTGASAMESFDTIAKSALTLFGEEDFDFKMMKNLPFGKLPYAWFTEGGQESREEAWTESGEYKNIFEEEEEEEEVSDTVTSLESEEEATGRDVSTLDKYGKVAGVDLDFIRDREGFEVDGYVPKDKAGKPIGNSGVTIASGLDLGQHTEESLREMDIEEEMITKLKPYLSPLKKQAAMDKLVKEPLNISREEGLAINATVKPYYAKEVQELFDASGFKKDFEDMPTQAQTVLVSVAFQHGVNTTAKYNLWNEIGEERYEDAMKNLRGWGGQTPTRRNVEATELAKI